MSDTLTLYKLIVLKMLSFLDHPLTNSQISEFILEKEYTNYFTLQQVLFEMEETRLVTKSNSHNSSLYHITDAGKDTLHYFGNKISDAICQDIQDYLKKNDVETARAWQMKSIRTVEVIIRYGGGVRGGKAIMKLIGIDCGSCRLPIKAFSVEEYEKLKGDLDAIKFFEF